MEATEGLLRRNGATPLYIQLEEIIRDKIALGEWQVGDRVPSENELNAEYGVSRMTARSVLNGLANEGLVVRVSGKGTFVAEPKIETTSPGVNGFRHQLEASTPQTVTKVISLQRQFPSSRVAKALGIGENEVVYELVRVRSSGSVVIGVLFSWMPVKLIPDFEMQDTASNRLTEILRKHYGLQAQRMEEQLESTYLNARVAELMGMEEGQPTLLLEDLSYTEGGMCFEFCRVYFRGDKVKLHFTFER